MANRLFVEAVSVDPDDSEFAWRLLTSLQAEGRGAQARLVEERMRELGMLAQPAAE